MHTPMLPYFLFVIRGKYPQTMNIYIVAYYTAILLPTTIDLCTHIESAKRVAMVTVNI